MRTRRPGPTSVLLGRLVAGAVVAVVAAGCTPAEPAPVRAPSVSTGSAQAFPEPDWPALVDGTD
ncbi:MAG TPA: hypothetical protein VF163_21330, partial [Micromonosporaceae bacterium]